MPGEAERIVAGLTYPPSWDQPWCEPPGPISDSLRNAMWAASERLLAMTPAEKQAMFEAQRQSFIRAMEPCEHGDPDWETCPECRRIRQERSHD